MAQRALVRVLFGQAGPAGGAADVAGRGECHLFQVLLAHEADEDAACVVIPRDAGDHCYLELGVGFRRLGFGWLLGLRVLLIEGV